MTRLRRRDLLCAAAAMVGTGAMHGAQANTHHPNAAKEGHAEGPVGTRPGAAIVVDGLDCSILTERYIGLLQQGTVHCMHRSMDGLDTFADLHDFIDSHPQLVVARSVEEIQAAHDQGRIALVLGWQDATYLEERIKDPNQGRPKTLLRAYYEMGLRIIGLCYNIANTFGAGNMEGTVPLSRAGRVLVEDIHHLNMLLDVGGHTGERTSLDAIAMSQGRPVICSHANIAAIADNPRNLSDRLIDAIAATGGVIGLSAVNDFHVRERKDMHTPHSPRVGVSAYVDQMEYLKRRVGVDHIGIGPDFTEGLNPDYDTLHQSLAINGEIISEGPWLYVEGFENIARLGNVTAEMRRRGWKGDEIDKVLGMNWLRVYRRAWGA